MPPKYVKPTSSLSCSGLQAKYKMWFNQAVTTPCQQVRSNKNATCNGLSKNLLNKTMCSWDPFTPGVSIDRRYKVQKPRAKSKNAAKPIIHLFYRPHEDVVGKSQLKQRHCTYSKAGKLTIPRVQICGINFIHWSHWSSKVSFISRKRPVRMACTTQNSWDGRHSGTTFWKGSWARLEMP